MKEKIDLNNKTILVTGAAGFIGAALMVQLLNVCKDSTIVGVDSLVPYYDVNLKKSRLEKVRGVADQSASAFAFHELDISDEQSLRDLFQICRPSIVVNLAAQAGVRYSITNPDSYMKSNMQGFYNVLECCADRDNLCSRVEHLVYASSSSVYGGRTEVPFKETDDVSAPVSLYAATKKSNELLAHSYAKLYNIPSTGLRFFTVYGEMGRPDMAYFSFTEKLKAGEDILIFNYGNCERDFTYIDDIVGGIVAVMQGAPVLSEGEDGLSVPPYSIYNIGHGSPVNLMEFVKILAEELVRAGVLEQDFDIEKHIQKVEMQPGDVPITYADTSKLEADFGYQAGTPLREGLRKFAEWYAKDYCVS